MTTKRESNASPFNIKVVSLTGASESLSIFEVLSETERLGLQERFAARRQHFDIIIGLKGRKRIVTMVSPNAAKAKNATQLKLAMQQRFVLLGCDKYVEIHCSYLS